jgi:hypothetical protein
MKRFNILLVLNIVTFIFTKKNLIFHFFFKFFNLIKVKFKSYSELECEINLLLKMKHTNIVQYLDYFMTMKILLLLWTILKMKH